MYSKIKLHIQESRKNDDLLREKALKRVIKDARKMYSTNESPVKCLKIPDDFIRIAIDNYLESLEGACSTIVSGKNEQLLEATEYQIAVLKEYR